MEASLLRSEIPHRMILMGVAGSGKSSIGEALADRLGITYLDGDILHPQANIAKMSNGTPLTDEDRWPWLAEIGQRLKAAPEPLIIGCSALKRAYRSFITDKAEASVLFIYLAGSKALISSRMQARSGHFMPTSLLDSQFKSLEEPAADENAIHVDIDQPIEGIVEAIVAGIARQTA